MKKAILKLGLLLIIAGKLSAQTYDDGYVTNSLPVNTSGEKYYSFVKQFDEGIDRVLKGEISSNDQIVQYYGYNILDIPKLDDVVANGNWTAYGDNISEQFISKLQGTFSRVGTVYNSVYSIRTALRTIIGPGLSGEEAESLAAIDIAIQETSRRFFTSLDVSFLLNNAVPKIAEINLYNIDKQSDGLCATVFKLPGWVKCALGVIGEAVLGGFGGIKVGAMIGGPIGAAVCGIGGVAVGAFHGATKYC